MPDGTRQLWLVMQLLRGLTLETLLDGVSFSGSDTPSVTWAAAITAQIAAVLADVHRVDIVHREESAVPSVAATRPLVPPAVDALVMTMLAKDPAARPDAEAVYRALLPIAAGAVAGADGPLPVGPLPGDEERRNPVRPFRQPLLGLAGREPFLVPADGKAADETSGTGTTHALTEEEATRLRADVQVLLDGEHPSDAISLLEAAFDRAVPGSVLELQMRRLLAAALLIGGQYGRAAPLFEQAGNAYREHLGAADPWALDCAYQAGHAYAQAGKPDKALPQLRYYVMNAASLAARDADEAAKVMESRFVIAQLLASTGEIESAVAELRAVRPLLLAAYGPDSAQVRNLDKQAARLRAVPGRTV